MQMSKWSNDFILSEMALSQYTETGPCSPTSVINSMKCASQVTKGIDRTWHHLCFLGGHCVTRRFSLSVYKTIIVLFCWAKDVMLKKIRYRLYYK